MAEKRKNDVEGMVIGGCTLMGLGVGFFLLEYSALYLTASIVFGVGLGLFMTLFVGKK